MMYLLIILSWYCHATTVESVTHLTKWIIHHGGSVNEKRLEPFESSNGLGIRLRSCPECNAHGLLCPLIETSDFTLGLDPLLLRVPYKLHMTPFSALHSERTLSIISLLKRNEIDYNSLLTVALALELQNESSQWQPYLSTLPKRMPRFGSRLNNEEITLLYRMGNRHSLASLVEERIVIDHASHHRIAELVDAVTLEEYLLATALVNSRAFGESPRHFPQMTMYEANPSVAVLIPYLDLFNHAPGGTNRYSYEAIAEYDVYLNHFATNGYRLCHSPGEELFNSYHTNDELNVIHWLFYGFLIPHSYTGIGDCEEVNVRHQAIAQHFQFGPTQSMTVMFNTSQLDLLSGHQVLTELYLYVREMGEISTENPVMQSLIKETISLTYSAIQIVERLRECQHLCIRK